MGTQSVAVLVAGTWWIPGVGEVVITVAGVIVIGGAVISGGTWVYNKVVNWFEAKADSEYEDAKDDGTETDDHEVVKGKSSLPTKGKPRSLKDLDDGNGVKQRRYYDENGNADMDIDYRHGGTGSHTFPHRHDWTNGSRGSAY
ncbi:hypothetical protein [Abyssisolibacter fermentans]|uniref:hypothetical protein n=1 Tax=Abyssisolibacter fermentans TaxID=1766203 RepID=UPI00082B02B5|nr:hypothetical protein [Abyssisolibacter fermentans]